MVAAQCSADREALGEVVGTRFVHQGEQRRLEQEVADAVVLDEPAGRAVEDRDRLLAVRLLDGRLRGLAAHHAPAGVDVVARGLEVVVADHGHEGLVLGAQGLEGLVVGRTDQGAHELVGLLCVHDPERVQTTDQVEHVLAALDLGTIAVLEQEQGDLVGLDVVDILCAFHEGAHAVEHAALAAGLGVLAVGPQGAFFTHAREELFLGLGATTFLEGPVDRIGVQVGGGCTRGRGCGG